MLPPRPRHFSTASKVYPSYLPHLRQTKRMPSRWFKPVAALLSVGIAFRLYTNNGTWRRGARIDAQAEERIDAERRRQNALMDQYGARDSLEDLEQAVQYYQKKQ